MCASNVKIRGHLLHILRGEGPQRQDEPGQDILRQGGVENCDAVAAVSEDDTVNLMAAQIAKSIFRREKVICRVSDPHLQVLYHKTYELDTICPTILTEQAVFRALAK